MKGEVKLNRKELKNCILITCVSYTVTSTLLSLLAFISGLTMEMANVEYLQIFACCIVISILIHFSSKLPVESEWAETLIAFLAVALVIYGMGGGIFKWFAWELKYIIEVFIILVLVFLATNGFMLWQSNETAKAINKKIEERKK